jgi:hypothetical protein
MDPNIIEQVLDELFPSLEALEAQNAAILQFLKDKGVAKDEQLAPYLKQAGNASNLRWRVARLRVMSLLSSAIRDAERSVPKERESAPQPKADAAGQAQKPVEGPRSKEPELSQAEALKQEHGVQDDSRQKDSKQQPSSATEPTTQVQHDIRTGEPRVSANADKADVKPVSQAGANTRSTEPTSQPTGNARTETTQSDVSRTSPEPTEAGADTTSAKEKVSTPRKPGDQDAA